MLISLVIPTFNEADNLPNIIEKIFAVFRNNDLQAEVVIVDDNSPDGTWHVAEELKSSYNLVVLRRLDRRGLSSAVIEGFKLAKGEIIGVMDADLSHPPERIPELIKPIISGESDYVIGSRYIPGGDIVNWPLTRRLSSKIATALVRGLTTVKDPMSGFFFFRKEVIKGVGLSPRGFKIGLEVLVKGNYKSVKEVPIVFTDREYGESKLQLRVVFEDFAHISRLYLLKYLGI